MVNKKMIALCLLILLARLSFCRNCGKEGGDRTRISGGHFTGAHQYPWMVSFSFYEPRSKNPSLCGGSLISDRLILTAKHCTQGYERWGKFKVSVHDVDDPRDFQEVYFKKTITHATKDKNDMAIILLKYPVNLRDPTIGIICLPDTKNEDYTGETARAAGWGMEELATWGRYLKYVDLEVDEKQDKLYLYTKLKKIKGVYQDPCAGDSGGPLMLKKYGHWTIIGTVNGDGYDCRNGKVRGLGKWNKVTAHLKWIKDTIKKYSGSDAGDYLIGGNNITGQCLTGVCGSSCNPVSGNGPGVCDGEGRCVSPIENICSQDGCEGKFCGEQCLSGMFIIGMCDVKGSCEFDFEKTKNSCGIQGTYGDYMDLSKFHSEERNKKKGYRQGHLPSGFYLINAGNKMYLVQEGD